MSIIAVQLQQPPPAGAKVNLMVSGQSVSATVDGEARLVQIIYPRRVVRRRGKVMVIRPRSPFAEKVRVTGEYVRFLGISSMEGR